VTIANGRIGISGSVLFAFNSADLQPEGRQRHAEDDGAVDEVVELRRRAAREEDRDRHVQHEEDDEERLDAVEVFRAVVLEAPRQPDEEGEREAHHVQRPPRLVPGDGRDAEVQHQEVAEERDVAAATGGREDRREEAARGAEDRQHHRVLPDGQDRREDSPAPFRRMPRRP